MAPAIADDAPRLNFVWPPEGAEILLGHDALRSIGVLVRSNFKLLPAGQAAGTHAAAMCT